jgi:hypothetical protein
VPRASRSETTYEIEKNAVIDILNLAL